MVMCEKKRRVEQNSVELRGFGAEDEKKQRRSGNIYYEKKIKPYVGWPHSTLKRGYTHGRRKYPKRRRC